MKSLLKNVFIMIKNRSKKVVIGKRCNVAVKSEFGGMNVLQADTVFNGTLGYGSYIGNGCYFLGTQIGKFCSIASNVIVASGNHPTSTFVSTHPAFFSMRKQNGETFVDKQKFKEYKYADLSEQHEIIIENDVWIGTRVMILPGVTIGNGSIVAAGSVVNKNVEPYSIVAGVPAKIVKYRFNKEQIDYLLAFQWWNKSVTWIKDNAGLFEDIDRFMQNTRKQKPGQGE